MTQDREAYLFRVLPYALWFAAVLILVMVSL